MYTCITCTLTSRSTTVKSASIFTHNAQYYRNSPLHWEGKWSGCVMGSVFLVSFWHMIRWRTTILSANSHSLSQKKPTCCVPSDQDKVTASDAATVRHTEWLLIATLWTAAMHDVTGEKSHLVVHVCSMHPYFKWPNLGQNCAYQTHSVACWQKGQMFERTWTIFWKVFNIKEVILIC